MTQAHMAGSDRPSSAEGSSPSAEPLRGARTRPAANRLPTLTGMRFAAAFLVFLNHAGMPIPLLRLLRDEETSNDFYKATEHIGALGVAFFFVLSGFVLTWSARPRDTVRAFWRRRFVKIYPNYVITWALAMVVFASAFTPARMAISNALMVHVWVPDFEYLFSVNSPSWSLGCEAVFYACFPLMHRLFSRIRPERLLMYIAGVAALVIATPWISYTFLSDTPTVQLTNEVADASAMQSWFAYFLPPVRMLDFVLGMLLAQAVINGRWRNIGMAWSSLLLVVSYVLCLNVPTLYAQRSVFIIPIVLMIGAAAMADVEGQFTLFRNRAMVWLGEISFAFYLLHFVVLALGRKMLPDGRLYSTGQTAGLVAAMFAATVLASWILYALVERPITRRWSTSRRKRLTPD